MIGAAVGVSSAVIWPSLRRSPVHETRQAPTGGPRAGPIRGVTGFG